MNDYISRSILVERIKSAKESAQNGMNPMMRDGCFWGLEYAIKEAEAIPAADVVERKQGKWLDVTTLDNEFICWVCSECRHGADFVYEPYNYCPNCGSYMRGDSDV